MSRFIKFLMVFTLILGSAYTYTGVRLMHGMSLSGNALYFFWSGILILIPMIPVSYYLSQIMVHEKIQSLFSYLAFTGLGFFSILFSLVLLKDFGVLLFLILQYFALLLFHSSAFLDSIPSLNDSSFLSFALSFSTLAIAVLLTLYGFFKTHVSLKTIKVEIPIANLHEDLIGFTIVQISDVHIGATIKSRFMRRVVAKINHLKPDLVAITGDLVDGPSQSLKQHLLPLGEIESKYGTFYVTGNHEYYSGVMSWIAEIKKLGISVLLNENKIIKHNGAMLTLGGVTDLKAGSILPAHATNAFLAMKGGEKSDYKILLAHQPNSIYEASKAGFDLQLSGHTHGGQYFPGNILIYLAQRFVAGLHTYENMLIYVSRGTGYWGPPLRIGAPSEITKLVLIRA